uniref:Secreted protein n=1 Tax=Hydatigena taeniaeformis TaxID=6205 RepID=A0A0R3WUH2_HYDTA
LQHRFSRYQSLRHSHSTSPSPLVKLTAVLFHLTFLHFACMLHSSSVVAMTSHFPRHPRGWGEGRERDFAHGESEEAVPLKHLPPTPPNYSSHSVDNHSSPFPVFCRTSQRTLSPLHSATNRCITFNATTPRMYDVVRPLPHPITPHYK